jgi:hypothetical protein
LVGQKGDSERCTDPTRGPTEVRLTRNNLIGQSGFCPIVALFEFLSLGMLDVMAANKLKPLSEQVYVPLFPAYDKELDYFHFYEPILVADLHDIIQRVLDKCNWHAQDDVSPGETLTPHCNRSAAAAAAFRAGHDVITVQQGGGWNTNSYGSIMSYASQNRMYVEDFKRLGQPDPMFRFWTYVASFVKTNPAYRRRKPYPGSLFKTNWAEH